MKKMMKKGMDVDKSNVQPPKVKQMGSGKRYVGGGLAPEKAVVGPGIKQSAPTRYK